MPPILQWAPTFVGFVAILVSVALAIATRRRPSISYDILQATPVVPPCLDPENRVNLTYLGRPVSRTFLIRVKITNSGNVPIRASDFESPIVISVGVEPQILIAEVSQSRPRNLSVSLTSRPEARPTQVELAPCLLNPGDYVVVSIIASNFGGTPTIKARVVGVRKLKEITPQLRRSPVMFLLLFVGGGLVALASVFFAGYLAGFFAMVPPESAVLGTRKATNLMLLLAAIGLPASIVGWFGFTRHYHIFVGRYFPPASRPK